MLALTPRECKRPPGTTPRRPIRHGPACESPDVNSPTRRRDAARYSLALMSAGAGVIHLALGPEHMREWVVLGSGFFASGVLQLAWGAALMKTESRRILALGALGSALFVGVWLVSRTTGMPFGPAALQPEGVGVADVLCVVLESLVALGALVLLRRPSAGHAPAGRVAVRGVLAGMLLSVLATTGIAIATPAHDHGSGMPCPSSPVATGVDANHNKVDDGVEAYFGCLLRHEHDNHTGHTGCVAAKL